MKTKNKIAAALALLLVGTLSAIVSPTVFMHSANNAFIPSDAPGSRWMKALDGGQLISQISLPGTHNSAALFEPIRGTARCQNLSIAAQLNAGVRFLDIRCRHQNDAFAIYHGPIDQHETFAGVTNCAADFLLAHPSETLIISVQETQDAEHNTRSFEATFDATIKNAPGTWLVSPAVPTLNQARGKIVLLCRFKSNKSLGIDASDWPDNRTFENKGLRVQDVYQVRDYADKWNATQELLNQTRAAQNPPLTLNFSSGVRQLMFGIPNVPGVSNEINPRLTRFFAGNPRGHFGCVIVDFADTKLSAAIYGTNSD